MNIKGVIVLGVVIHTTLIISIFDIYFKSPIVNGVVRESNENGPLASRVVFISVDGLRFDSLFDKYPTTGGYVAPYVRNIIENKGSWGISECHLPTESRPGHVAMLAGFYEDPSAVMKGWKQNPVDFDSVFNTSHCTLAWGSPDIVSIFSTNLQKDCLYVDMYNENDQQFAGPTTQYDNWVYDKLFEFLNKSENKYSDNLKQNGIFYFLHLLGQDTSGHTDKPHTDFYRQNLHNVDQIVRKIENLFTSYYTDRKTTYILTSDHGMTDWGSHGAGDPTETRTPFIIWGSSINQPQQGYNLLTTDWGLSHLNMINIEQADITPLITVLLGTSIPTNSIGLLPYQYLNTTEQFNAESIFLNAKQMAAHFTRKLELVEKHSFYLFYKEFPLLNQAKINTLKIEIKQNLVNKNFNLSIDKSKLLIKLCLEGLDYYHNYYQKFLFSCVTCCYLFWSLILLLKLFYNDVSLLPLSHFQGLNSSFAFIFVTLLVIINSQKLPILYNVYIILPLYLLYILLLHQQCFKLIFQNFLASSFYLVFLYCFGIEMLVVSFFERWILSISMFILVIWESVLLLSKTKRSNNIVCLWVVSGFIISLFPLLPVIGKKPQIINVLVSGLLWVLFSLCYFLIFSVKTLKNILIHFISLLVSVVTICNIYQVNKYFVELRELLKFNQVLSIFLSVFSILLTFISSKCLIERLYFVAFSLSVPFLLMCVNHEGFFLFFLSINLFCWLFIEYFLLDVKNKQSLYVYKFDVDVKQVNISSKHFRLGFFLLNYICIGFFGIGNIASLNSFDPSWVRCFITKFSPFTMTLLILFKTIIPFVLVLCSLKAVTVVTKVGINEILVVVLIYCNLMGLNFLFLVKNKGSWLDIGTSISHYIIQQTTVLFLVLLYVVAHVFTTVNFHDILFRNNKTLNVQRKIL